jgi:hypothetical protein
MVYTPGAATHNPAGAVVLFANEDPCIFTARCIQTCSGGQFVFCSGTLGNTLGSVVSAYAVSDLNVCPSVETECNGIALYNVASGTSNYVAVARKGVFLVRAGGPCSGGCSVFHSSGGVASATAVGSVNIIGRSFNAIDEGLYGAVALNC